MTIHHYMLQPQKSVGKKYKLYSLPKFIKTVPIFFEKVKPIIDELDHLITLKIFFDEQVTKEKPLLSEVEKNAYLFDVILKEPEEKPNYYKYYYKYSRGDKAIDGILKKIYLPKKAPSISELTKPPHTIRIFVFNGKMPKDNKEAEKIDIKEEIKQEEKIILIVQNKFISLKGQRYKVFKKIWDESIIEELCTWSKLLEVDQVWRESRKTQPVHKCISAIRKKLGSKKYIKTTSGTGCEIPQEYLGQDYS